MCNACVPILVGVASLVLELKFGETSLSDHAWTIVHGDQKIKSTQKFYASRG